MVAGREGGVSRGPRHLKPRPPQFLAFILFNAIQLYGLPLPLQGQLPLPGSHLGLGSCLSRMLPWHGGSSLGTPSSTKGCGSPLAATNAQNGGSVQPSI